LNEQLAAAWPTPIERLVLLAHSMGGLVARSACHFGVSRYSAPLVRLGKIRSAGVTDMRHGNVLYQHWQGRDRFAHRRDDRAPLALPQEVRCYAIGGQTATQGDPARRRTDGLVSVDSALGVHARQELTLGFPEAHRWIAHGTGHLELLSRRRVYAKLCSWLSS
jgi:hypothetical protein